MSSAVSGMKNQLIKVSPGFRMWIRPEKVEPGADLFIASCNINRVMDAAVTTLERFITLEYDPTRDRQTFVKLFLRNNYFDHLSMILWFVISFNCICLIGHINNSIISVLHDALFSDILR